MGFEADHVVGGRYRLVRPLATGGMGSIWVARHLELDIDVAIKFVTATEGGSERALKRFRREARIAAGLNSQHVVRVLDFGVDDTTPYLAMELLRGEDLLEHLETQGRLTPKRVALLLRQIGRGLEVAHDAGIVHRDLKPSNLFLARTGKNGADEVVKILDFGVARSETLQRDADATDSIGMLLGSPPYMSPEQARAGSVDHRADLWALGAITFEMLTGNRLFAGGNLADTVAKICSDPIPRAGDGAAELGSRFDDFFRRALERDPDLRFQSASELCSAFESAAGVASSATDEVPTARGRDTETLSVRTQGSTFDAVQGSSAATHGRAGVKLGWIVAAVAAAALIALLATRQLAPAEPETSAAASASARVASPPAPKPRSPASPTVASPAAPEASSMPSATSTKPAARAAAAVRPTRPSNAPSATASSRPNVDPVFGLPTSSE